MRTTLRAATLLVGILVATVAGAMAQDQTPPRGGAVPIRVQLVISLYQADKKISAAPFTFICGEDQGSRIRVGVEVPITTTAPPPDGKKTDAAPPPTFQYRPFGTNIDCMSRPLDNGRFKLSITVEESAPYSDEEKSRLESSRNETVVRTNPVFKSMRMSDVLLLKDGQTEQMSSAVDRFSGEVVKVDVTLTVIK